MVGPPAASCGLLVEKQLVGLLLCRGCEALLEELGGWPGEELGGLFSGRFRGISGLLCPLVPSSICSAPLKNIPEILCVIFG